jgi:pimeloyl-ACP methyl ester carboxylesterase
MGEDRIHRATSADGTEVAGRVTGEGPPLLLLPAGPGDSETSWKYLVPLLSERFTCYLMDTRGRGLSDDHPDHSPDRLVEDVIAFADGIGEAVGLVGWGTALWALASAQSIAPVFAAAAYEPGAYEAMDDEVADRLASVLGRVGSLVADGREEEAARALVDDSDAIYAEDDIASGAPLEFWTASAATIGVFLQEEQQAAASARPGSTSPEVLADIPVPVLLLHGSESRSWFVDSVRHVAAHVPDPTIREVDGAGHWGPYLQPGAVADEMTRFFTAVRQPA